MSLFMNGSLFLSALCGYFLLPVIGWRWLFAALFVWVLRKGVPESPRWRESKGRTEEAERIVAAIEREAGVTAPWQAPARVAEVAQHPLFSRSMVRRLLLGLVLNIGGNATVYGFIAWVPTFFVKQGLTVTSSLGFTALMSFGGPVGAVIGILLADRSDRRRMIVALSLLAAALGAIYPLSGGNVMVALVGFALVPVVYVFVSIAWASYVPERFPTELRLRGAGFCNAGGRLAAVAMPFAVVPLFNEFGVAGVAALLCGILVVQAALVGLLGIATNKRPLEALASKIEGQNAVELTAGGSQRLPPERVT